MQRIMTYGGTGGANEILQIDPPLTPNNRCLSKSVAIANDADPEPLENYENNRLVPASVIEPGSHWIDEHTVEHYFVDENGNKINDGLSLSITLPRHGEFVVVRTKALLDGQPFPDDIKGGGVYAGDDTPDPQGDYYGWVHNDGRISFHPYHVHAQFDIYGHQLPTYDQYLWDADDYGMIKTISHRGGDSKKDNLEGITTFIFDCDLNYSRANMPGGTPFHILMTDWFANPNKLNTIDVVNLWNIQLSVDRKSLSYDIDRAFIDFEKAEIGQSSASTNLTGFGYNPDDYEILYVGWYSSANRLFKENEDGKISTVTKKDFGTSFIVTRTADAVVPEGFIEKRTTRNLYKIYKKDDPSILIYFVVSFDPIDN